MQRRRMGYQMYNIYLTCIDMFDIDEEFDLTYESYIGMMHLVNDYQEIDTRGFKVAMASLLENRFLIEVCKDVYKIGDITYKKRMINHKKYGGII